MSVIVKHELAQLKKLERKLRSVAKDSDKAVRSAIGDTLKNLRTLASKEIRLHLNAKKKPIDNRLKSRRSRDGYSGTLTFKNHPPMSLSRFKPKQTTMGVSVKLSKGSETFVPGGFGPKIKKLHGGVYRRTGKSRFPIAVVPAISMVTEAIASGAVAKTQQQARPLLEKNLKRRINLAMLRHSGVVK